MGETRRLYGAIQALDYTTTRLRLGRGEIPDEKPQQEEKREVASQPSRFLHVQPPPHQLHLRRPQIRHFALK